MKFIMVINIKMSTVVGILTFISIIILSSEKLKTKTYFIFTIFAIMPSLVELEQSYITLGPGCKPPMSVLQLYINKAPHFTTVVVL